MTHPAPSEPCLPGFAPRQPSAVPAIGTVAHRTCRRLVSWPWSGLLGMAVVVCLGQTPAQSQQDPQTPGIPELDPFADELNPFGSGRDAPAKPQPTGPVPIRPRAQSAPKTLPMPFPERTVPGEPAERRPPAGREQAAKEQATKAKDQAAGEPAAKDPAAKDPAAKDPAARENDPAAIERVPATREKPEPALDPFPQEPQPEEPRLPEPVVVPAENPRSRLRGGPDLGGSDLRPFPDVANTPATDMEPSPAEQLLAKAEKFDRQGKLPEARDALREAVKLDPKLTVANLALGVVLRRLGDLEGAVEACSAGIRVDPLDSELYLRRGIAWYHRGLHGIALEDFEDASGIAYDDPRPELWRGLTLMQLGRPLEAINAYAAAIRRDRTFMIAYLNRGTAYLATGEAAKAEFDFDLALRHDPRDVRAWFNRGVALAQQRKYQDAIKSYEMALKIDPSHVGARRNLEAARSRLGSRSGGGIPSASSSSTSSAGSSLQGPQQGVEVLRSPPPAVGL